MIDLDDVCITNVNRQLPAIDGQIGRPKVQVLAERVRGINPACRVEAVAEFFTRYDYLLNGLRLKQSAGTLSEQDLYAIDSAFQ